MSNSNTASIHSATAAMVEGALCIALAVVLSKVNLFALPNGSSVDAAQVGLHVFSSLSFMGPRAPVHPPNEQESAS